MKIRQLCRLRYVISHNLWIFSTVLYLLSQHIPVAAGVESGAGQGTGEHKIN